MLLFGYTMLLLVNMENDMNKSPNCNWSGGISREKETGGREGSQPTRGGQAET